MKDLKPEVSPAAKPINPAELRRILRDRVGIFGKEDQQVKMHAPMHVNGAPPLCRPHFGGSVSYKVFLNRPPSVGSMFWRAV